MAESFITVINGVVTGKHHGDIEVDFYGTPYYAHNKIIVPFEAEVAALELLTFYTQDWKRKSDAQLIEESIIPMPQGYVKEGKNLRQMSHDEKILAGLIEPSPGLKVEEGKLVPMTIQEQIAAGLVSQDDYNQQIAAENEVELQNRLAALQTPEALAMAELDEVYAAERKAKLIALLAVKQQKGYPLVADWSGC